MSAGVAAFERAHVAAALVDRRAPAGGLLLGEEREVGGNPPVERVASA